jgi:hypothetical protein
MLAVQQLETVYESRKKSRLAKSACAMALSMQKACASA